MEMRNELRRLESRFDLCTVTRKACEAQDGAKSVWKYGNRARIESKTIRARKCTKFVRFKAMRRMHGNVRSLRTLDAVHWGCVVRRGSAWVCEGMHMLEAVDADRRGFEVQGHCFMMWVRRPRDVKGCVCGPLH